MQAKGLWLLRRLLHAFDNVPQARLLRLGPSNGYNMRSCDSIEVCDMERGHKEAF